MTNEALRRKRLVWGALAACALLISGAVGYLLTRSPATAPAVAAASPRAPSTTAASTSTPSTSAAPAPTRPAVPHDVVPAARPTAMTLTGPRFTISAHVCAMANVRPYDPPGEQHHTVCWVRSGFGVTPSSAQRGTSYLFGHSWAEDQLEVLNKASAISTKEILRGRPQRRDGVPVYPVHALDGYRLVLRTRTGTLTYVVRSVYGVRKLDLGAISSWLNDRVPGRVVLTTCAERGGVDYDYNVVIEAYLASSQRAR